MSTTGIVTPSFRAVRTYSRQSVYSTLFSNATCDVRVRTFRPSMTHCTDGIRPLDSWSIPNRIREWHSELNYICTTSLHSKHGRDGCLSGRKASCDKCHEDFGALTNLSDCWVLMQASLEHTSPFLVSKISRRASAMFYVESGESGDGQVILLRPIGYSLFGISG